MRVPIFQIKAGTQLTTTQGTCRVYSPPGVASMTHRRPVGCAGGSSFRRSVRTFARVSWGELQAIVVYVCSQLRRGLQEEAT